MTKPIYRDKMVRMAEDTMASMKLLGWEFYMTGPNEWQWMRFAPNGLCISVQCDPAWASDLQMIHELKQRKIALRNEND